MWCVGAACEPLENPSLGYRCSCTDAYEGLSRDNQATIFTANNPETSQRSKHLEIRWFRIRDYVKDLVLRVRHIPTGGNVADFFTKSLQGPDSFERFRRNLMGDQDFKLRLRV